MSTTKDLLSQNEIDSLLEIFSSPHDDKNSDILFGVRMAKVAKGIESYLENLGLVCDDVKVSKHTPACERCYSYALYDRYLDNLSIDNTLALRIIAARFGSKNRDASLERVLTSLEQELIQDVCKEIVYILEKELDSYMPNEGGSENIMDQGLLVLQGDVQHMISFTFTKEPVAENLPAQLEKEEVSEGSDATGTKVEAVLGTIATKVLKPGLIYKINTFAKNRAVLLLDESLPFMANRLQESDGKLLLLLQEAVTDKRLLAGFYLNIAGTTIDDETLMRLERGTFLELHMYDDVQIHKDGKMVAKAKILVSSGEIAVKIFKG